MKTIYANKVGKDMKMSPVDDMLTALVSFSLTLPGCVTFSVDLEVSPLTFDLLRTRSSFVLLFSSLNTSISWCRTKSSWVLFLSASCLWESSLSSFSHISLPKWIFQESTRSDTNIFSNWPEEAKLNDLVWFNSFTIRINKCYCQAGKE